MSKLTKKQQLYISTALAQPRVKDAEIARQIGVAHKTICMWKHNPDFNEAYDNALKSEWKDAARMAKNVMEELAANGDRQAAQYILDSNGWKPTDKVELDATINTIKVELVD